MVINASINSIPKTPQIRFTASNAKLNADFIKAAEKGYVDTFIELLTEGNVDINAIRKPINNTALIFASGFGRPGMVEGLIAYDAELNHQNVSGNSALMFAAQNGHVEIVKMLLDAGADKTLKNTSNETALIRAKNYGHNDIVTLLNT